MARGRKTSELTFRAIRLLDGHMEPVEIAKVLRLPVRTIYDQICKVREEVAKEEAARLQAQAEEQARIERDRLDRERLEAKVIESLRQERERYGQPIAPSKVRKFLS